MTHQYKSYGSIEGILRVTEIDGFPDESELPTIEDIVGILA